MLCEYGKEDLEQCTSEATCRVTRYMGREEVSGIEIIFLLCRSHIEHAFKTIYRNPEIEKRKIEFFDPVDATLIFLDGLNPNPNLISVGITNEG